jgi:hypothetical protein
MNTGSDVDRKRRLGRFGAWGKALLNMTGAALYLFLPPASLAGVFLPFSAALHERYMGIALLLLGVFYIFLATSKSQPRCGYLIGSFDSLCGFFYLIYRAIWAKTPDPLGLGLAVAMLILTLLMIFGLLAKRPERTSSAAVRGLAWTGTVVVLLYLAVAYWIYATAHLVGHCWPFRETLANISVSRPPADSARYRRRLGNAVCKVYYGELHGHSGISVDARIYGAGSPEEYYRYARDGAGLDFCALTDHDTPDGLYDHPALWKRVCRIADEFYEPGRFVTFKAFEWTSGEGHKELLRYMFDIDRWGFEKDEKLWGHRNVYFPGMDVPERVFSHTDPDCDTPEELREKMKPWGALAIVHHPLGGPVPPMKWDHYDPVSEPLIEIYSHHGNSESIRARYPIYNPYTRKGGGSRHSVLFGLRQGYHFGFIGGTDTHTGWGGNDTTNPPGSRPARMIEFVRRKYGGVPVKGGGLAGVFATALTREAIWEALWARRVFATTGPRIVVDFQVDGRFMGEEIAWTATSELRGTVLGTGLLQSIEIVRDGPVVHEIAGEGQRTVRFRWIDRDPPPGSRFYYIRAIQEDGEMAWSSPVRIKPPRGM